jgi:hypothetical protein
MQCNNARTVLTMKRLLSLLAVLTVVGTTVATAIDYNGGTYSENFNSIFSNDGYGLTMYSVGPIGAQEAIPTLTTWRAARVAGTGIGTFALFADWGGLTPARLYSYGTTAGSPIYYERALGGLASANLSVGFGTYFYNASSYTYDGLSFSFDREVWRNQSAAADQSLAFAYGFASGAGGITDVNFLTSGGMTAFTALNATSPATLGGTQAGRDGNADPYMAHVSATITGILWAPGDTLFIRWNDKDDTGSDAGIAIDNLNMTALPEPSCGLLLGLGFAALTLLRRNTR